MRSVCSQRYHSLNEIAQLAVLFFAAALSTKSSDALKFILCSDCILSNYTNITTTTNNNNKRPFIMRHIANCTLQNNASPLAQHTDKGMTSNEWFVMGTKGEGKALSHLFQTRFGANHDRHWSSLI